MNKQEMEHIYLTVIGMMAPGCEYPGVENAFAPGSVCEEQSRVLYELLTQRLGVDDPLLSEILDAADAVQREVSLRMFRLGMEYGEK